MIKKHFSTNNFSKNRNNLNKNINNYNDVQNENEINDKEYDDKINYIQNKNNNNEEYDDNVNDDMNNNIKSKINYNDKESTLNNKKINTKIINSYEYIKSTQDENLNRNKNKNEYEENQFIDYLREAILHENKIESLKIDLSLRSDFIWEEIFRIFELEGRGFLSKEDLIIGFNKFGLYPKDSDISLLLKRYDLKKEGFISYPNFFDLIAPFSKYHRIMLDKRKINSDNILINPNEYSRETLDCIRNLFVNIFNGEFILNKIKESFTSLKIKFNDIFKMLDPMEKGYFGEKELAIFLQKNGIFNNSNDCDLIFLRINKLRNGKIDFQEMCDEIEPVYE